MNVGQSMRGVLLGFVGDLHVRRERPAEAFEKVATLLRVPDVLFGNLEGACSDDPDKPASEFSMISSGKALDVYKAVGFKALSLANNHILDAGYQALLTNIARLNATGVVTCGAGANLQEARRAGIVESHGRRIGFLAYSSVFPIGSEAGPERPGIAPLRSHNQYRELVENYYLPGYLPRVETHPDPIDHENLISDIGEWRAAVDTLIVSVHWGDHQRPYVLTDHEVRVAKLCIDHGADVVVGHHHHALRGIEWYNRKPIFYGLGHFVLDFPWQPVGDSKVQLQKLATRDQNSFAMFPREGWPYLPMHADTRMTVMGWVRSDGNAILDAGFVPCRIDQEGRVFAVDAGRPEGRQVAEYVQRCNRFEGLNGQIVLASAPRLGEAASFKVVPSLAHESLS